MRFATTVFGVLLLAAGTARAEDFSAASKKFKRALQLMSVSEVRRSASDLAAANTSAAVGVLHAGFGACTKQIKAMWGEKAKWRQQLHQNSDFEVDFSRNPPILKPGSEAKYLRFQEAEKEVRGVERKIMKIEAMRNAIIEALGALTSDSAVKALVGKLRSDSDWTRKAAVAEALGMVKHADVVPALVKKLGSERDPAVRVSILGSLTRLAPRDEASIKEILEAATSDDYWQVRSEALRALAAIGSPDARFTVPKLIEMLDWVESRGRYDVNRALVALTGIDRHGSLEAWKSWWEQVGSKGDAGAADPGDAPAKAAASTTFYGIPVDSDRVVFIVDRSGSMMEPSDWGVDVENKDIPGVPSRKGNTKMDVARWQLKRCLALMKDDSYFNIIFFSHELTDASIFNPKAMVKLTSRSREAAFTFIDKVQAIGGTNIYDPVEKALSWAGSGPMGEKLVKSGVDTIFLMTDGIPNQGQIPEPQDIMVKLADLNRYKKVRINTIGLFSANPADPLAAKAAAFGNMFLGKIAKDGDGKHTGSQKEPAKKKPAGNGDGKP